jgi:Mg-chelatase subunit ChlD
LVVERRFSPKFAVALSLFMLACSGDGGGTDGRAGAPRPGNSGTAAGSGSGAAGSNVFGNPNAGAPAPTPGRAGGGALPPSDICEAVHVNANPATPDMLIVLDRSGSMTEGGRWMPSVSALRRVTMELQSSIRFGLAMFPDPASAPPNLANDLLMCLAAADPQACIDMLTATVVNVCAPGKMVVPVAIDNAAAIGQAFDMTAPAGGTPTGETLQSLVDTFGAPQTNPDEETIARFVLLVTDGQPTCPAGMGMETTQPDIDLANSAIDAFTARGVRTYVIGYDTSGPGNEMFAAVLDGFAQRGGTGDTMHRPVEDEQSLLTELQRIAGDVVSCSFVLDEAPPRADFVLVRLDGKQINLNDPNGWMLVGDRNVQLTGTACETLKDGAPHSVDVEVRCSVVIPE